MPFGITGLTWYTIGVAIAILSTMAVAISTFRAEKRRRRSGMLVTLVLLLLTASVLLPEFGLGLLGVAFIVAVIAFVHDFGRSATEKL